MALLVSQMKKPRYSQGIGLKAQNKNYNIGFFTRYCLVKVQREWAEGTQRNAQWGPDYLLAALLIQG
jgi:hypothetical protein